MINDNLSLPTRIYRRNGLHGTCTAAVHRVDTDANLSRATSTVVESVQPHRPCWHVAGAVAALAASGEGPTRSRLDMPHVRGRSHDAVELAEVHPCEVSVRIFDCGLVGPGRAKCRCLVYRGARSLEEGISGGKIHLRQNTDLHRNGVSRVQSSCMIPRCIFKSISSIPETSREVARSLFRAELSLLKP